MHHQSVDFKAAANSCGSMHHIRSFSVALRGTIGYGAAALGPGSAGGGHLRAEQLLGCTAVRPASALQARRRKRAAAPVANDHDDSGSTTAAAGGASDAAAATSRAEVDTNPATSSSSTSDSSARHAHEPVAAAITVAKQSTGPQHSSAAIGPHRAYSSSRGPPPTRRLGPRGRLVPLAATASGVTAYPQLHMWDTASADSSSSFNAGGWGRHDIRKGPQHMGRLLEAADMRLIQQQGLAALQGWGVWGDFALLQQWEQRREALPQAVQQLRAVSQDGPVKVVMFDLETCGTRNDIEVLEIASVTSDKQEFQSLIRPLGIIPYKSTAVHTLTFAKVCTSPPVPVVLLQWLQWLTQQCVSTPGGSCRLVLAGHNIKRFDVPILNNWLETLGLGNVTVAPAGNGQASLCWDSIDTTDLAKAYKGAHGLKGYNLGCMVESLGIHVDGAHRALEDSKACKEMFMKLVSWQLKLGNADRYSLDDLAALHLQQQEQQPQQQQQQKPAASSKPPVNQTSSLPPTSPRSQQAKKLQLTQATSAASAQQQPAAAAAATSPSVGKGYTTGPLLGTPPRSRATSSPYPSRFPGWRRGPLPGTAAMPGKQLQQQQQQDESASPVDQQEVLQRCNVIAQTVQDMDQPPPGVLDAVSHQLSLAEDMLRGQDGVAPVQQGQGTSAAAAAEEVQPPWSAGMGEAGVSPFSSTGISSDSSSDSSSSSVLDGSSSSPTSAPTSSVGDGESSGSSSSSTQATTVHTAALGVPIRNGSSRGSIKSSRGATAGSPSCTGDFSSSSSSSSGFCALDYHQVESAVTRGLESLEGQNLTWDRAELTQAWPLLGEPLDPKDKVLSPRLYEKLMAAGFTTHLQVLLNTPSIMQYHSSIPIDSDSSSSSSSLSASGPAGEDTADAAGDNRHLVYMQAKCLAASNPSPVPAKSSARWSAFFEAPTDPPSAGPVGLQVNFFVPSKSSSHAMQLARAEHQKALQAISTGEPVLMKGRVRPFEPSSSTFKVTYTPSTPELPGTWETTSSPAVQVSWDGSDLSAGASSEGDCDSSSEGAAASTSSSSGSSSSTPELLEPVYRKNKDVLSDDWLGKGRSKGIIPPLLEKVRGLGLDLDPLPAEVREKYGFSSWLEDMAAVHRPGSRQQHEQACRGLAFRELVLMQLAQMLERYRLTWASGDMLAAAAPILMPTPRPAASQSKAAKPKVAKPKASPKAASAKLSKQPQKAQQDDTGWPADTSTHVLPVRSHARKVRGQGDSVERTVSAYGISSHAVVDAAKKVLTFQPTDDQERVLAEILEDMRGPRAMLRLLQGDVGCGKTLVAVMACLAASAAGFQALIFAPTELLAKQHYRTLLDLVERLPLRPHRPRVALLVGSTPKAEKDATKAAIAQGRTTILISTQAALWVKDWHKLALVVVDEQHKLGVKQRERLTHGLVAPPHMLLMTATPIPRTLAILQYGGLVLSKIEQMPPGRSPVETHVVNDDESGRQQAYEAIKQELAKGGRAYIVCPLVDDSDTLEGVRTVENEFARLSNSGIFGDGSECGKLHGKMEAEQKAAVLERFRSGETPVLIASTVVEVGVDVPEASIMLVEGAHRFGLAQLHQLRGRVGRGDKASRCYLMAPPAEAAGAGEAAERLRVLEDNHNGLSVAEFDLKIRGPGDLWSGIKQSGKISQFSAVTRQQLDNDLRIIVHARLLAAQLLPTIGSNPALKAALLAYGFMELREGQQMPVARYGISGI